ncbi:MAG: enoyl-CoA hydratase/isomerase family protein [Myxococcota bacterium]|nr:enoyl-CoA hydratase/isomerase family protein [Myxococcota bacterium]
MRTFETLGYEETGNIARVRLKRERINMAMVRELTAVCDHLEDDSPCDVVVFQGAGDNFSLGIDFGEFKPNQVMDIHGFNKWEKLCVRVERLPKITIAAIDGKAVGGGFQLALVTDARIGTTRCCLNANEVRLGFLPGMATFRLAKYVGLGHAKRIIMQSVEIGAEQGESLGLLNSVNDDLEAAITATIEAFEPIHPVTVQLARRLLNESFATDWENAIGNFLAAQHRAISQTAFLDTLKSHQD